MANSGSFGKSGWHDRSNQSWGLRKTALNILHPCEADARLISSWLTFQGKATGPEIGIGHRLGNAIDAAQAKFVCSTLGQTQQGSTDNGGKILDAIMASRESNRGQSGKYPRFKGNVAAVYSYPLSQSGSSGSHYGGNAETYMNVGEAMGKVMVKLLASE